VIVAAVPLSMATSNGTANELSHEHAVHPRRAWSRLHKAVCAIKFRAVNSRQRLA